MERALEQAVSKVWAAQIRARGLGEGGRGHPRHQSTARAWTAGVSPWGAASLGRWKHPKTQPAFPRGASLTVAL